MLYGGQRSNAQERTVALDQSNPETEGEPARRPLSPAAERALAEAEARRRQRDAEAQARAKELGGRAGPDPVRYGDWENGGIASDF
ncbi:MAG: DUF1674 domain-containing protein [Proteobacteria bacterium]|nr:DUF1674 domain-containing protein [Pseudomonadota bacterium]